jgi:hypothetical protein
MLRRLRKEARGAISYSAEVCGDDVGVCGGRNISICSFMGVSNLYRYVKDPSLGSHSRRQVQS